MRFLASPHPLPALRRRLPRPTKAIMTKQYSVLINILVARSPYDVGRSGVLGHVVDAGSGNLAGEVGSFIARLCRNKRTLCRNYRRAGIRDIGDESAPPPPSIQ